MIYKFLHFFRSRLYEDWTRMPSGCQFPGSSKNIWCSMGVASNFKSSHAPIFNDIASYPLIKKTKFSKLLEGCTTPIKKWSFIDFEINLFDLKDGKIFRLNIWSRKKNAQIAPNKFYNSDYYNALVFKEVHKCF